MLKLNNFSKNTSSSEDLEKTYWYLINNCCRTLAWSPFNWTGLLCNRSVRKSGKMALLSFDELRGYKQLLLGASQYIKYKYRVID